MEITLIISYVIAFVSLFLLNFFIVLYLKHREEYLGRPPDSGWRPRVSIIIPAYNEGKYIGACLETVRALDYPPGKLEIIVVDDGSTDDTLATAKSFEGSGLLVFTKKNGGKAAALNFGLKKATGELVATMDADSYLTPRTLLEMVPYFSEPDVMAVTPSVKIRPGGSWLSEMQHIEYLTVLFARKLMSFVDCVPVTPGPFSLFRASLFGKIGGFDEKNIMEDQEMALRIQSRNLKIRSSLAAEVYTEPPDKVSDLLRQRVRWQRGGLRNFWNYRFLIKPAYGDFGMFIIPMSLITFFAFFVLLGMMLYPFLNTPYYVRYIWLQSMGLGMDLLVFISVFATLSTAFFLWLSVRSFGERIKLRHLVGFMVFYAYLMLAYNAITLFKELRREPYTW
jgi:cellulose synthase/poly-beta-1,6-N-acetylglucosamine synthase-like glycosyltransferase